MNLFAVLLVVVVGVLLYLIFNFRGFASENDILKQRLENIMQSSDSQEEKPKQSADGATAPPKKRNQKMSEVLQNIGKLITPASISESVSKKLEYANIPLKANEFAAMNMLSAVIPLALGMMMTSSMVWGICIGAVGFYFPHFVLKRKIKKRRYQFQNQLLDNLVMLSNSMKAGYSFLQGLDLISKEAAAPSSEEFKRIVRENALGMDLDKSLNDLNERIASEDFDLVVTVIMIQRQIGGNLAEILDGISETLRERIRIKGQISTLTAQARMSGIVVALLPVGIFGAFSVIRPDLMQTFFTFSEGSFKAYYMLIAGGVMQGVGFLIIQNITNIEV
ncbi:MAG: type II secretion system F family protein [Candidatus Wallbacteria bacterium]|nr:type II secretion system F family protein [Candidatus Wallbacteria bacterium]